MSASGDDGAVRRIASRENPLYRELLHLAIEKFPDTRHSANAHHKLNEMNAIG